MNGDSIIRSAAVERGVARGGIERAVEDIPESGDLSREEALT
jgi:hypothetical protein